MFIKKISLKTEWNRVTFVNLTEQIECFIKETGVKDGMLLVQSLHTTCSVFYEEMVHDLDRLGYDFLQHDLIRGLNKIFPKQLLYDADYKYPGPKHRKLSYEQHEEYRANPAILLNADAHLKATLLGSSIMITIEDGKMLTGEFGDIYFVDWDSNRERNRTCVLSIIAQ